MLWRLELPTEEVLRSRFIPLDLLVEMACAQIPRMSGKRLILPFRRIKQAEMGREGDVLGLQLATARRLLDAETVIRGCNLLKASFASRRLTWNGIGPRGIFWRLCELAGKWTTAVTVWWT